MPDRNVVERAKKDLQEGKSPSTAAGEFVRQEIEHVRHGQHGARSPEQAIAIGLSEARRAGIPVGAPKQGRTSERTRRGAKRALEVGQGKRAPRSPSRKRSAASRQALRRERRGSTSRAELSRAAKRGWARRRGGSRATSRQPASRAARRSSRAGKGR